jgi:hypothetical protein
MAITTLLSTSSSGVSSTFYLNNTGYSSRAFQATVSGTGVVSSTVTIQVSNDNVAFVPFAIFTLSGTTTATDGQESYGPWAYIQTTITSISGTDAVVTVTMGT